MPRKAKEDKLATRQARLSTDFVSKLSVIANALSQMQNREITIAEAAEIRLGNAIDAEFAWALDQLAKLKKTKRPT